MPPESQDSNAGGVYAVILSTIDSRLVDLKKDIREVKEHVDEAISKVATRVEELAATFVTKEYLKVHDELWTSKLSELQKQVDDLNTDRKKYIGMVVGAVIVAVLALVIKNGTINIQ